MPVWIPTPLRNLLIPTVSILSMLISKQVYKELILNNNPSNPHNLADLVIATGQNPVLPLHNQLDQELQGVKNPRGYDYQQQDWQRLDVLGHLEAYCSALWLLCLLREYLRVYSQEQLDALVRGTRTGAHSDAAEWTQQRALTRFCWVRVMEYSSRTCITGACLRRLSTAAVTCCCISSHITSSPEIWIVAISSIHFM